VPAANGDKPAPFTLSTVISTLLEFCPQDPMPAGKPFQGRKLISFTDSRQGTARIAVKLQQDSERNRIRGLVYHRLLQAQPVNTLSPEEIQELGELQELEAAQNIGTLETKGFEVEANHQVNHWLGYSFGYTYLDNQNLDKAIASRYSLDNLRHQFVAKLRNNFKGLSNELIYRYNERVNLGSYNLLDDKISYQFKNFNVYVLVNNITNSDYIETSLVPMPGRWWISGVVAATRWPRP
jgi:hypothetical protein